MCLGFCSTMMGGGRSCGARPRPAARAALGGLRAVVRRDDARFACGCCARVIVGVSQHAPLHGQSQDARRLNAGAWRATGWHAQDSGRCAPPFTPQKAAAGPLESYSPHSRKRLPRKRPPPRMPSKAARAAATRRAPQHSSLRHTLAARRPKTTAARRRGGPDCVQPRCARGNPKGAEGGRG